MPELRDEAPELAVAGLVLNSFQSHLQYRLQSQAFRIEAAGKASLGQFLGFGGHTGYATGNYLHFEIRLDGNVLDPLVYLP